MVIRSRRNPGARSRVSQGRLSLSPMALCLPEPGLGANPWGTHGSVFARAWVETPPDERTGTILLPFCLHLGRSIKVPEPFDNDSPPPLYNAAHYYSRTCITLHIIPHSACALRPGRSASTPANPLEPSMPTTQHFGPVPMGRIHRRHEKRRV